MLKLSILDQSPISSGQTAVEALQASRDLAKLADELGYYRYWVSEHHNHPGIAGVSPEILLSHLASHTSRLRLGSGGVLLNHYSPYKVAENFHILEALFPGRIDLGIGRAPGGDPSILQAMGHRGQESPEAFRQKVQDLLRYLTQSGDTTGPIKGVQATSFVNSLPPAFLLGSSGTSARLAAELGTAFCFAHFLNPIDGPEVLKHYRETYHSSELNQAPEAFVCVYVVCAETDEAAFEEAVSLEHWLIQSANGLKTEIPSPEDVSQVRLSEGDVEAMRLNRQKMIVGSPSTVKAGLEYMARAYQTDEVMLLTNLHSQEARLKSYQLIAEVFSLPRLSTAAQAH
ncbi:LLM class flavin-dependent oxidoreductase [Pullulanibacillus sp. KACC 23026]|uniref:LLM class flavin-dependent oxidoreductase n=1 Tax=Pullulanibacillus sp. KACC 23026 TaxID=3028315 RepID=UPI0023B1E0FA|nr:LLM class flavin-dependent oxidoreductase [Pullulanibacillus sp. KACC 23026]WEG14353.1 LLM class flavin-dependent oxidoreductase [Pullulanibacillus sp. KACC 23026]